MARSLPAGICGSDAAAGGDEGAGEDRELFERIFLVDEIVDEIKKPDKYFLIGEKGSGKTAYSVYMSQNQRDGYSGFITLVENTLYQKFLNMKRQKALELSSYKDIWINLLYLILAEEIRRTGGTENRIIRLSNF